MNLITVPNPITIRLGTVLHLGIPSSLHLHLTRERCRHILDTSMGDIDSESLDTLVCPESQSLDEIVSNFLVVPVEIGLRSIE
jgi:hypothetical protein